MQLTLASNLVENQSRYIANKIPEKIFKILLLIVNDLFIHLFIHWVVSSDETYNSSPCIHTNVLKHCSLVFYISELTSSMATKK